MSEPAPRDITELFAIPLDRLREVGDRRRRAFEEMGVTNIGELIHLMPRAYLDRTARSTISALKVGDVVGIQAEVRSVTSRRTRQARSMVHVVVAGADDAELEVIFFHQAWRTTQLSPGTQVTLFGKVGEYRTRRQMTNPVLDVLSTPQGEVKDPGHVGRIVPVYSTGSSNLTSRDVSRFIAQALARSTPLTDPLASRLGELDLMARSDAYWRVHLPEHLEDSEPARRRLVFDELVRLQLLIARERERLARSAQGISHPDFADDLSSSSSPATSLVGRFLHGHHFELTGAQRKVLEEIARDMTSARPMHRLLQGDVGSGKTIVATCALLNAIEGGRQGVMMVPTEILAEQHVAALNRDLSGLVVRDPRGTALDRAVRVALLTGRLRAKERTETLAALASGEIDLVVGTHALLSAEVTYRAVGVIVIDEQHRFGVGQRATLRERARDCSSSGEDPDLLVMTATPIPRTAALALFGDLDHSEIDELPRGRIPIETRWVTTSDDVVWERVREELARGHRAYVICPLVDDSESVSAAGAVKERDRLARDVLAPYAVELAHGQMPARDREDAMGRFRSGEAQVLVATTVVEVGVDVPEATVMVIEDAWRFGLAQLHQLRGRVGRSTKESWCYLLGEAPSDEAQSRLRAMESTTDGFALADHDLTLRGAGTLLGAVQRGLGELRIVRLDRDDDRELLIRARDLAREIVQTPEELAAWEREIDIFFAHHDLDAATRS